jgi:hypothetical protein
MKICGLQWDDENIEHICKHGITPSEVEDVCFGPHVANRARYGRYLVYGKSYHGKYIRVVLKRLYGIMFRPKTAYSMTESEKKNYRRRIE